MLGWGPRMCISKKFQSDIMLAVQDHPFQNNGTKTFLLKVGSLHQQRLLETN